MVLAFLGWEVALALRKSKLGSYWYYLYKLNQSWIVTYSSFSQTCHLESYHLGGATWNTTLPHALLEKHPDGCGHDTMLIRASLSASYNQNRKRPWNVKQTLYIFPGPHEQLNFLHLFLHRMIGCRETNWILTGVYENLTGSWTVYHPLHCQWRQRWQ